MPFAYQRITDPLFGQIWLLAATLLSRTLGTEAGLRIRGYSKGFLSSCHTTAYSYLVWLTLETSYLILPSQVSIPNIP